VLGPLAAGALLVIVPVEAVLLLDAASFVASALLLSLIALVFRVASPLGHAERYFTLSSSAAAK